MTRRDELRQIAKVADLYYGRNLKQTVISELLGIHQSSISRMLHKAKAEGIVRITLAHPAGFYPELERALESRFGLARAVVVDPAESESQLLAHLGSAAASIVAAGLREGDVVGISSWSSSLLAMVNAMEPFQTPQVTVVQILGGVGNPSAEVHATYLTQRLAQLVNGRQVLLTAPGLVRSSDARDVLYKEPYVRQALDLFNKVSIALVGIGAGEPSPLLADSGNIFTAGELKLLRRAGAVGDICMRFFDKDGAPVSTPLDDQVVGISLAQLKRTKRVIAVAGGTRKKEAIAAALKGGLIDVLVTDYDVASAIAGRIEVAA